MLEIEDFRTHWSVVSNKVGPYEERFFGGVSVEKNLMKKETGNCFLQNSCEKTIGVDVLAACRRRDFSPGKADGTDISEKISQLEVHKK